MRHTMKEMFPESSQKRIQEAVKEAESRTSGEIVPFVVNRSDEYAEAEWRCGAFFAILALLVLSILRTVIWLWIPIDFTVTVLSILLSGLLGYLITRMSPWAKRLFAGTRLMERRVAQRAAGAFISEEVFRWRISTRSGSERMNRFRAISERSPATIRRARQARLLPSPLLRW